MGPFVAYSLPIQGLKNGVHQYQYTLDSAFFACFEDSPLENAEVNVKVQLDKRSDMLLFDFVLDGYFETECDRCTAAIELPFENERQLIVKYGDAEGEEDDEVVFLNRETADFNLAQYLYEFTVLSLPITNTYDCQNDPEPPCNFEILKYLSPETPEPPKNDSIWDALKGITEN